MLSAHSLLHSTVPILPYSLLSMSMTTRDAHYYYSSAVQHHHNFLDTQQLLACARQPSSSLRFSETSFSPIHTHVLRVSSSQQHVIYIYIQRYIYIYTTCIYLAAFLSLSLSTSDVVRNPLASLGSSSSSSMHYQHPQLFTMIVTPCLLIDGKRDVHT